MKTFIAKKNDLKCEHVVIDATGIPLGRLSVKITDILRGKDKPIFSPHLDIGSHVIVINALKVLLTGKKNSNKTYKSYSGYRGGLKIKTINEIRKTNPGHIIKHAVWGMMPHGRLGRKIFKKLRVYNNDSHPHNSQKPKLLKLMID